MNTSSTLLIIGSYLLGSVNSAILICLLFGLPSPRTIGSGNPGTTNVLRAGGKLPAALTLLFDVLKGVVFVLAAKLMHEPTIVWAICAFAAVIGHMFPIFFKFQGGKGVATTIGACFALNIWMGFTFIWVWLFMAGLFRYSSLSALVAVIFMPLYAFYFMSHQVALVMGVIALLVIIRHHENIKRLIRGHESKIGQKAKADK